MKRAIQPAISTHRYRVRKIDDAVSGLNFSQLLASLDPKTDSTSAHGSVFIEGEGVDEAVRLIEAAL